MASSQALLRGFLTAVGITIFVTQLVPIFGIEAGLTKEYGASSTVLQKLSYFLGHFKDAHFLTLVVSGAALSVLVGMRVAKKVLAKRKAGFRWIRFVPEVLLVVLVSTRAYL